MLKPFLTTAAVQAVASAKAHCFSWVACPTTAVALDVLLPREKQDCDPLSKHKTATGEAPDQPVLIILLRQSIRRHVLARTKAEALHWYK
jgi:hypothetical protein